MESSCSPVVDIAKLPSSYPYEAGVARRAAIIDAALELFGEVGYRSASLREVAARVGVSHPGLLHHFANKAQLLEAVLEERERRSVRLFNLETSEPLDMLRNLVALAAHNAQSKGLIELYCVLSAEATSPSHPAHDYFVTRYRNVRVRLTAVLDRLHDEGLLRDGVSPEAAAVELLAYSDGIQLQWLLDPDAIDLAAATHDLIQGMLVTNLGAHREASSQGKPGTT